MVKVSESKKWHVKDQYLPWGMVETQFGGYDKAKTALEQGRIVAMDIDGEEWYKVKTMEVTRGAEVRREKGIGTSGQVTGDWLSKAQDWLTGLEFDIGKPLDNQVPPTFKAITDEPVNAKDKDPMVIAMAKVKAAHTNLNNLKVKALEAPRGMAKLNGSEQKWQRTARARMRGRERVEGEGGRGDGGRGERGAR